MSATAAKPAALEAQFASQGYVILRGVLTPEQCQQLRERILATFQTLDAQRPDVVVRFLPPSLASPVPGAWDWLVHEQVVSALQAILEPRYTLIPDLHIQRNMVGSGQLRFKGIPLPRRWGWHQDASSEGRKPIHVDPQYRVVKCGVYLQENDPEHGGGIDIVPGSHRLPLRTGNARRDWQLRQLMGYLGVMVRPQRVQLQPGDVVIFHSFLWHTSTMGVKTREALTDEERRRSVLFSSRGQDKLVLYIDACRDAFADDFLQHNLARARSELKEVQGSPEGGELFFCDVVTLPARGKWPAVLTEAAARLGIRLGALDGEALAEAMCLWEAIISAAGAPEGVAAAAA